MSIKLVSVAEEPIKVTKKFYTITLDDEAMAHIIASLNATDECIDEDDFSEEELPANLEHIKLKVNKCSSLQSDLWNMVSDYKNK